jgi:hypothetical protein
MYMGGIVVYADDDFLTDSSYFELGLLCLGCDNDVIIRGGKKKRRHFSHRKAISERERHCAYRASSVNKMLGGNFAEIARNQRREIFHAYLIQFITRSHRDFHGKINGFTSSKDLDIFIEECVSVYDQSKVDLVTQCRQIKNINIPAEKVANNLISGEVFSYLGSNSGKSVLRKIILYATLKIAEDIDKRSFDDENISIEEVIQKIKLIILETSWDMLYKPMSISQIFRTFQMEGVSRRGISIHRYSEIEGRLPLAEEQQIAIDLEKENQKRIKNQRKKQRKLAKKEYLDSIKKEIVEELQENHGGPRKTLEELERDFKKANRERLYSDLMERYAGIMAGGYPITCPHCRKVVSTNFPQHITKHYERMISAILRWKTFKKHIEKVALEEFDRRIDAGLIKLELD